jgi:uncharacterized membrane protein YhhN
VSTAQNRASRRRGGSPSATSGWTTVFSGAYVVFATIHLAAEWAGFRPLILATKPLLMPVLAIWIVSETRSRPDALAQALLVAIAFSFLGDVFLMLPGDLFLWGLGSFLVGHLAYLAAFWIRRPGLPRPQSLPPGTVALSLPIHLFGATMAASLLPRLGDLRAPVLVYMAVIFGMGLSSVFRRGRVSRESFWPVYAGACAFIVSDSIIALDRFVAAVPRRQFLVMVTYALAQYWITKGLLIQHREESRR